MTERRAIPSIEQLRQRPAIQRLTAEFGHQAVVDALRREAEAWRARLSRFSKERQPSGVATSAIV